MSVERILEDELSHRGLTISIEIKRQLCLFARELLHWNKTVNLTSLQESELVRRLLIEPIWIGRELHMSGRVADIGSGNGSPGIPLFLGCGLNRIHVIEARARRVAFLRHVAAKIGGSGIVVHKSRVEELEAFESVDWITLQAVAPSAVLLRSLQRLFEPPTRVVWITSRREAPTAAASRICVRGSQTEAWVFKLDQF